MRAELSKLHNRLQTTMIYVTHDQTEAMTMGDRIVVMKDGQVQQVGPPLEIYSRPDNMFVAGFIGSPAINFLNGRVESVADRLVVDFGAFRLPLPEDVSGYAHCRSRVNQEIVVGVRPEDIIDSDLHPEYQPDYCLDVTVDVLEMLGSEAYLNFTAGGFSMVARVEPGTTAKDGSSHRVAFNLRKAHLFDPVTTQAIR
jgi:multiple sugar transport system ATP-binding protein